MAVYPDVQAIEILNEPNNNYRLTDFPAQPWNGYNSDGSTASWIGAYVNLLNRAASAIKAANPRLSVIGLGATTPADYRMMAAGISPLVDGLTDHPYPPPLIYPELIPYNSGTVSRDGLAVADNAGTFVSYVRMWRAQAAKYGVSAKIWHTEWGVSTAQASDGSWVVTEENQAVFIARRLIESYGMDVEHSFIYDFKDESANPFSIGDLFGLIRVGLVPKQGYHVVGRITSILRGLYHQDIVPYTIAPPGFDWTQCRAYGFNAPDMSKSVVAVWHTGWPLWNIAPKNVTVCWHNPGAKNVYLYDVVTGTQVRADWQYVGTDFNQVHVNVAVSSSPLLLIIQ